MAKRMFWNAFGCAVGFLFVIAIVLLAGTVFNFFRIDPKQDQLIAGRFGYVCVYDEGTSERCFDYDTALGGRAATQSNVDSCITLLEAQGFDVIDN